MTRANGQKHSHFVALSSDDETPFLARFAERVVDRVSAGGYDDSAEVWLVRGEPLAAFNSVALETMTDTRTGGESQDND